MARVCIKDTPSSFRHRVALQAVTRSTDSQGGYSDAWATSKTLWASIKPVKAYERFQAMQLETPITHKVTMRYTSGVTSAHRLLFGTRVFHIVEVLNHDEANAILTLTCKELEASN